MKRTFTLIAALALTLALVGCSTTRTAATADHETISTTSGMASSSSTSYMNATAGSPTNYGGTAATTGTTAIYGSNNSIATANFDTGVQTAVAASNSTAPTDINTTATTDTSTNVGMSCSMTTPDTASTATDSGARHHRHRAMHKE